MKATTEDVSYEVNWLPFFLSPNTPEEGIPLLQYIGMKYGPQAVAQAGSGKGSLHQAGAKYGLKFDSSRYFVNSLKSHCLMDYAKTVGKQNELTEVLFESYFKNAKRIDQPAVLKEAAEGCGIEWSAAEQHMSSPDVMSRVKMEASTASASGIHGVPHFNIFLKSDQAKGIQFSGAQPPSTILNVFQRLLNFTKSRV